MQDSPINRVVILTGAGVSAESGLATFRAVDGLWEQHRVEDVATPQAFERDPSLVHRFYNARRRQLLGDHNHPAVRPNAAHRALAECERAYRDRGADYEWLLVTQNVDNLHEQAGSEAVWHMHGELLKMRCASSGRRYSWMKECSPDEVCTCCNKQGTLRPDIVWFGEIPFHMDAIAKRLSRCDLFISIGTSGNVYPAAGFFQIAQSFGAHTVELNLEPSQNASRFSEGRYGAASEVVPQFTAELLERLDQSP